MRHTCAVKPSGHVACWGANDNHQVGRNTMNSNAGTIVGVKTPRTVPGTGPQGTEAMSVRAGGYHSCMRDRENRVYCWGGNETRAVGAESGETVLDLHPVAGDPRFDELAAGRAFTCGRTTDAVLCWGANLRGTITTRDTLRHPAPTTVLSGTSLRDLGAGRYHACVVDQEGAIRCWGNGEDGQLGNGARQDAKQPVTVKADFAARQVTGGVKHSCALSESGRAYGWGNNEQGQLGNGSTSPSATPVEVSGDHRFVALDAGYNSTCGVTEQGELYCWGANDTGQLGDGSTEGANTPVAVRPPYGG